MKLYKVDIKTWIESTTGEWFDLSDIKKELQIDDSQYNHLRKVMYELCKEGVVKSLGGKTGRYRKIDRNVEPVKFWESQKNDRQLLFPKGIDGSSFSFQDWIELEPVSAITIGGVSNSGKTALAMGLLLYNIYNYNIKYISSENNRYNFYKRILKVKDDFPVFKVFPPKDVTDCNFQYLKKTENYEDLIFGADLYIIDWVNLVQDIWTISTVIGSIKDKLDTQGSGIAVIVLQKDDKKPNPRGDTWVKDNSDLLFTIDMMKNERRLTITKCKVNGSLDGRMWGFSIDEGIFFKHIREIVLCDKCHGQGEVWDKQTQSKKFCTTCSGLGYRDREDYLHDV